MEKLVLIDGHSILSRAFYGVPNLSNSKGVHTNAVYGFLTILFKILDEEQAQYLMVAFDVKAPTFRHEMFKEYKGTRKPMPQELTEQVPLIKEVLTAMGVPIITKAGYEADDLLGTIAKRCQAQGVAVSVVSGDRDLLQLADQQIKIRIPKTSKGSTQIYDYYPADVVKEYQVTPAAFIDVKALMGDSSDNIPGVPSIGEKTATALIVKYGSLDGVYEHLEEVTPPRAKKNLEEHRELAMLSRELATIEINCEIEFSLADAKIGNLYTKEAYQQMKDLEFKSLLSRFSQDLLEGSGLTAKERFQAVRTRPAAEACFAAGTDELVGFQLLLCDYEKKEKVHAQKREVAGLAISWGEQKTFVILVGADLTAEWLLEKLARFLAGREKESCWVLNLKEMLPYIEIRQDTLMLDESIAGYLLNPLKDTYEYDDLARDYLGITVPSKTDLLGKTPVGQAVAAGSEQGILCAGYMAYTAWKSGPVLKEKLAEEGMWNLFLEIEMPLIYRLYDMEQVGIKARREALEEYGDKLKIQIARLEKEIHEESGEVFNINSPKQLGEVLFGKMQLKGGKKTKTGYSTAADVLEKLAPEVPVVRKILDYRQLTKLNSTYAEGLAAYIGEDGRIHGKFNQTITATGRISSTEPNLQNIPVRMELGREIRKVFVPADGYVFVDADYSQIELRILASMSGDERLIKAYRDAEDIHALTASEVFHIPLKEVTPLQRRNAKAVNFGIVYGISAFGLSEDLSITRKEALDYINKYFETYPGVKAFLDDQVKKGKEMGYVTTQYGRKRPIPELTSSNFMQRSFGERVAMNSPIQGTAADIMKIAMIRVDRELKRQTLKSRIVLQVHDELLVETWEPELEQVKTLLVQQMKQASDLAVPLDVEAMSGKSWFDAK